MAELNDINKTVIPGDKPQTPENLNYTGDTFLKKGDKNTAIKYYFQAAEKLHFAQKEKKLAIYKKIISISPSEIDAYEEIIKILIKNGLVAEAEKYLLMLAKIYQSKSEYNKVNEVYRRIRDINPDSKAASKFFTKGKQEVEEGLVLQPEHFVAREAAYIASKEKSVTDAGVSDFTDSTGVVKERVASKEEEESPVHTTIEESFWSVAKTRLSSVLSFERKKIIYVTTFILLLLIVAIVFYSNKNFLKKDIKVKKVYVNGNLVGNMSDDSINIQMRDYDINLTLLNTEKPEHRKLIDGIDKKDQDKKRFYFLSIKMKNGCLSDKFAIDPLNMISLIKKDNSLESLNYIKGFEKTQRVIYRSNICNREFGVVFAGFVVFHDKAGRYRGLLIHGLEIDQPLKLTWEQG